MSIFLFTEVEVVALFQCTSPFLALPFIHSAFGLLSQGYDSVFSVNRVFKLRWHLTSGKKSVYSAFFYCSLMEKKIWKPNTFPATGGTAQADNFNPARRPRRQDWSGELVENGMFYFISRHLVEAGLLQGGR